ncbi:MAG: cupin domain-containing protein [Acidobacteria bacterium]|nr:cupin domain-containing protein [Acidobacteriota bacterium]
MAIPDGSIRRMRHALLATLVLCSASAFLSPVALAKGDGQAIGGPEKGRPVAGDPGISSMVVMDRPDFRVLRDWAEPNAVRRMHNHADATYHVFTLLTGQLVLTIEGQAPVDVKPGDVVELKGGVMHTFKNTGTVTATIVEVFGKAPKPGLASGETPGRP